MPIAAARSQGWAALPAEQCTVATLMERNHAACPDVPDTCTSRRVKDRKNCRAAGARAFRWHMMILSALLCSHAHNHAVPNRVLCCCSGYESGDSEQIYSREEEIRAIVHDVLLLQEGRVDSDPKVGWEDSQPSSRTSQGGTQALSENSTTEHLSNPGSRLAGQPSFKPLSAIVAPLPGMVDEAELQISGLPSLTNGISSSMFPMSSCTLVFKWNPDHIALFQYLLNTQRPRVQFRM